jgi:hypothetical protein
MATACLAGASAAGILGSRGNHGWRSSARRVPRPCAPSPPRGQRPRRTRSRGARVDSRTGCGPGARSASRPTSPPSRRGPQCRFGDQKPDRIPRPDPIVNDRNSIRGGRMRIHGEVPVVRRKAVPRGGSEHPSRARSVLRPSLGERCGVDPGAVRPPATASPGHYPGGESGSQDATVSAPALEVTAMGDGPGCGGR